MEIDDFPHEPLRPISSYPFQPRSNYNLKDGTMMPQRYKVVESRHGSNASIIFNRRYHAVSYFVEGHYTQILKLEPLPVHENAEDESFTGIHWFIDVTHMSICQDVDAMPINIITKLFLIPPQNPDLADKAKKIIWTQCPPDHPDIMFEEPQRILSGRSWMYNQPNRHITDGVVPLDGVEEDEEDSPQRTITGTLW